MYNENYAETNSGTVCELAKIFPSNFIEFTPSTAFKYISKMLSIFHHELTCCIKHSLEIYLLSIFASGKLLVSMDR